MADVADELEGSSSSLTRGDLIKRGSAAAFAVTMFGGLTDRALGFRQLKYAGRALSGSLRIMTWAHFVPDVRHVARQHLRQGMGGEERRPGQGRPHQQRTALQHGCVPGRRAERPRPLLVHLSAVVVPEAGDSDDRPRPGGEQEGRPDDEGREEGHVQPEDEAVLRLPRDLRPRPRPVPAQHPAGGGGQPEQLGGRAQGGAQAQGDGPSGRPRDVERDRLEHAPHVTPLLLRRLHPERGEPDRHRAGRKPERRDPGADGDARHLPERHVRRGLRVDSGVEQPGVPRRPALGGAERDLDRPFRRELRQPGTRRRHVARLDPARARRCAWATST